MHRSYKVTPTDEDRAKAAKFAAEGWTLRSRKYRRLGRVPGGMLATAFMREHHPEDYARLLRKAAAALEGEHHPEDYARLLRKAAAAVESDCRSSVFHYHEEHVELSEGEFEAFLEIRRANGDCVDWWTPTDKWTMNSESREIEDALEEES